MFQRISTLFLVCLQLISIGVAEEATADTEANKALVLRFFEEVRNQQKLNVLDEVWSPAAVWHRLVWQEDWVGLEAVREAFTENFTAIPDFHLTVDDMIAEEDLVAARLTFRGTFTPTGKSFEYTGMEFYRIVGRQIAEAWGNPDEIDFQQQVGLLPTPAPTDGDEAEAETNTQAFPQQVTAAETDANKDVLLHTVEYFNKGNIDRYLEDFTPDVVYHRQPWQAPSVVVGAEAHAAFFAGTPELFPEFEFTNPLILAEGDMVAVHWRNVRGLFSPTGKPFEVTASFFDRFVDGKVAEYWLQLDWFGFQTQVGLLTLPEATEDFSNVFFASLAEGLNMISLPLKPQTPFTARSFAEELSSTVVVKFDSDRRRFVGFTLDAPDDGFPIEGGKGYIVNLKEATDMTLVGAPWTNEPPVETAPPLAISSPDSGWAFVVSGRITDKAKDGYFVTVRNTRTNTVATDLVRNGYFAPTFADLSRNSIVEVGDGLQITVMDRNGEIASEPILINVTADALRQAFVPITLTNVGKPNQSLLLQNYPNPFNPETWMPYQLQDSAQVAIHIYDTQGGLVRTLSLGQRAAGFYQSRSRAAYWDGHNDDGESVASGVYFYQLRAGDFSATRRMLIVK